MTRDDRTSLPTPQAPSVSGTLQPTPTDSLVPSFTPVQAIQPTRTQHNEATPSTQPPLTGAQTLMDSDLPGIDLSVILNVDNEKNSNGQSTEQPIEIPFSFLFVTSLIIGVIVGLILLKEM